MATIVIFGTSLLSAAALAVLKLWELRSGKRNVVLALISRSDRLITMLANALKTRAFELSEKLRYLFFVRSKIFARSLFEKLLDKILKEYGERREIIMGRKEIANRGSVSFYLRKIDETRQNGTRGEIN